MDSVLAKKISAELKGHCVGGWDVGDYIGNGKSAVVIKAIKAGRVAAIKIFEKELVARFGEEMQSERIQRECALIGEVHPNLIEIYDGGKCDNTGYYFIVMKFLPWKNLADSLKDIPRGNERLLISQIAAAAKFLEERGICHRDIKPENIAINDEGTEAVLLDLGVILTKERKVCTDLPEQKHFIGTLKYSPPEFLLRTEKQNEEGLRAITFYQLGGVLHDLITRTTLFEEFEIPYARLVNAVQNTEPVIESNDVSSSLVLLARQCLMKDPALRLSLTSWDDFSTDVKAGNEVDLWRKKIMMSKTGILVNKDEVNSREAIIEGHFLGLQSICRRICATQRDVFPPIYLNEIGESLKFIIEFPKSAQYSLSAITQMIISIEWHDSESGVIIIKAGRTNTVLKSKTPDASLIGSEMEIYRGLFQDDVLSKVMTCSLLETISLFMNKAGNH